MKIYISPENRPKPHGKYINYNLYEHDICCEIAYYEKEALERCGFEVKIADPDSNMANRCIEANNARYDIYQTIHTNAATSPNTATGCECLYYGQIDSKSFKANRCVYDELIKLYPSERGLKNGTGYYENRMTDMVSIYPEIAFHDNEKDVEFIIHNIQNIGESLCKGVCKYLNVDYIVPNPQTGNETQAIIEDLKKIINKYE